MQLVINIKDRYLVDKIVWFLESFKDKGVEIIKKDNILNAKQEYSDEYLEENWKELIMGCKSDPEYYKSEEYYEDRGRYLMEKYK